MTALSNGALFTISGEVSNNATWDEYIYFLENGSGMTLTGLSFQLQFRCSEEDTSSSLTLSTADAQLSITTDDNDIQVLRVNVPYTTISEMSGDYVMDIVSKDNDSKLTHWAHGTVTFTQNPIAF